MWRVAPEATLQTRWLAPCQIKSVGKDGCRIARPGGGCRRLAGTILMRMFGRPDGGLGRPGGHVIAHMNRNLVTR
jgi:hypothetical protein